MALITLSLQPSDVRIFTLFPAHNPPKDKLYSYGQFLLFVGENVSKIFNINKSLQQKSIKKLIIRIILLVAAKFFLTKFL